MNDIDALRPQLDRLQRWFLLIGVIGLIACAIGAYSNWTQFLRSYLLGYIFWLEIALGCFALVMLHHMVGGKWGYIIRRPLEAASRTIPLLALLFIPLLVGHSNPAFYPVVTGSGFKAFYLKPNFFFARVIVYFAAWIILAFFLNRWSSQQDQGTSPGMLQRFQNLSGPGILIYGFTISFAAIDWVMALDPKFFSTIFGMIFIIMPALAAMSFTIIVTMLLAKHKPLSEVVDPLNFNQLGNLLLTFVMLWAYMSFSQFLIIWAGNLQDEIPWYTVRATGDWSWVALFIVLFHFAVPFILLLNRPVKRKMKALAAVGAALIVMGWIDLYWFIVPTFYPLSPRIHWMDIVAPIGIGGIWLALFVRELKAKPLLPLHDPRFEGVVQHG
jgi:hypothetical protein